MAGIVRLLSTCRRRTNEATRLFSATPESKLDYVKLTVYTTALVSSQVCYSRESTPHAFLGAMMMMQYTSQIADPDGEVIEPTAVHRLLSVTELLV